MIEKALVTAGEEWRAHWPMVLAALIGLSVGTIPSVTLGVFMEPLQHEFGWSRTEISAGLTIFALVSLPLNPFMGLAVDRYGPRRIAILGVALSGLGLAAFSLLTGSLVQWVVSWILLTLASLAVRSLVWTSAISEAFSASLGLAIAILLCGTGVGQIAAPYLTQMMISAFGWRSAYLGLGFGWTGIALVFVFVFFRNFRRVPASVTAADESAAPPPAPGGLTVRQALRSPPLLRIAFTIFAQTVIGVGVLVHLIPMLVERGVSPAEAAGIAALLGLGSIFGKLAHGWLTDHTTSTLVPTTCYAGPALGYLIVLSTTNLWALSFAVFVMGYFSGGSQQMTAYLTTRYAGLRNFGAIFGIMTTASTTAAGVGPVLAGAIYDRTGNYTTLFSAGIVVVLVAGAMAFRLGRYPDFAPADKHPAQA